MRGIFNKRIEVDPLIPYSEVRSIDEESSGAKTMRIVLRGNGGELARIDFSAGGMDNTPEMAAGHRRRILRIVRQAAAN